ncbi:MAG: hypothetical protein DME26_18540 [Verrucomicrobia bacterium]|nr:MAG: hypothetical protein DME26_18540 [Verrucomicrobiota bacterium]
MKASTVVCREVFCFALASLAVTLLLFWPAAMGVPANHYVIDLILGDVSRNWLVYQAWEQGEMPWWDPYTDGGKPLPAEANAVNISDPFKVLLFHLLPFELAYNWARLVPFIISGLAAFCLLRYFHFSFITSAWGGFLYQFAGCNAVMFSGPTIQASFAYYPLLWLLWDLGAVQGRLLWFAFSTLLTALIFLSGNLQSHSYVFLLAVAFAIGYGWRRWQRLVFLASGMGLALGLGLCLAAPFLFSQLELFLLSVRRLQPATLPAGMLSGLASLVAVFPWGFGTFRTLDASKFLGQYALGFWIYIGSAALLIALIGVCMRLETSNSESDRKRTALALLGVYFVVCSTPLLRYLYTRTAWLAVLGLVVLFAMGWLRLAALRVPSKRWGWAVVALALVMGLVLNVGGLLIYPRLQSRIEAFVLKSQRSNTSLDEAIALRKFQAANFGNEVTFKNRETLVAFLGLLALGVFLLRTPTVKWVWLNGILVLSTLPLLWFAHRYIPMHPISLWEKLRAGGPEQRRVIDALRENGLRVRETAPGQHEYVFPGALAQLFKVHTLQGHTSLGLMHAGYVTNASGDLDPTSYDVEYRSPARGMERGELIRRSAGPPARIRWAGPGERSVSIVEETLNTITLAVNAGPPGGLIRTDTYYPGWQVAPESAGVKLTFEPPCFARIQVPAQTTRIRLVYAPCWWRRGICVAALAGLLLSILLVVLFRRLGKDSMTTARAT